MLTFIVFTFKDIYGLIKNFVHLIFKSEKTQLRQKYYILKG